MPRRIPISDHAFRRYVERVLGIDPDETADMILPPDVASIASKMGDGVYTVRGSHRVIVKGGAVVTVLKNDDPVRRIQSSGARTATAERRDRPNPVGTRG